MTRRDWIVLLCITLLAGGLRFYQLGVVPPGPQFDEAFNALDAELVMAGNRPLFLPANGGREVLYTYIQASVGALLGLNLYTLRLVSALAGTLTVVALYFTVRGLFRRNGRWLAATAALALAVSYWHIHFSHYGIRVILMPLLLCGVFGLFWLGMHASTARTRLLAVLGSGALAGLSVWTNPTGRLTPFVVGAYVLWLLWRYPTRRRLRIDSPLGGLLLFGVAAFVVFLPLGLEFWRHPEFFTGHASEVSIFAERVTGGGSPWPLLWNNVLRVLGMFSFDGDLEWAHGIPDRPVFDWFMALPFYIGAVLWLLRLIGKGKPQPDPDRDALALFALWAAVMLAPSVLSEAAPNYSRTLPSIPAVMLAAGLGLTWIATLPRLRKGWGPLLAGALVAASVVVTFYDYFIRYPAFREVYYLYDADKVDAVAWMEEQADAGNAVYLSPLWSTHSTIAFLRSGRIESLDATDAIVLPPAGMGAVYAWPAEQQDYAEDVADRLDVPVELANDAYARPLLAVVRLAPEQAAQWPADLAPEQVVGPGDQVSEQVSEPTGEQAHSEIAGARFDDAPTLLGLDVRPGGRDILLFWRAEQKTLRDLTSFVHLIGPDGERLGQIDKTPGDGTYHTQYWTPGDRVIQRYRPELTDVCAGGTPVQVVTGWYEYAADNARRPRLDVAGDSAVAGTYVVPFFSVPADSLQPAEARSIPLAQDGLTLNGYTVKGDLQPGTPLAVDLVLAGGEQHAKTEVTWTLTPADQGADQGAQQATGRADAAAVQLWAGALAPRVEWDEGELLCRRLQAELPPDLAPGRYVMQLTTADYMQPFGEVVVNSGE
jgi:4-amino-4-deoxy-L-arabinose transferase-like glycosyltransferase